MPLYPPLPKTRDAQFEWFHALAQSLKSAGFRDVHASVRSDMLRFTTENLPSHSFPDELEDRAFIESVQQLRTNESAWNRALQTAIIKACDKAEAGERLAAAEDLERFASSCPWALFAEVARDQASQFTIP